MAETKYKQTEITLKELGDIAFYAKGRETFLNINTENYVGVDNLLPNRRGKIPSNYVPKEGYLTQFLIDDVLIGNIRPYLKKIWIANINGATNGDVLVVRVKDKANVYPSFLYQALSSDKFFAYNMQKAKGTKMPRGDKKAIMDYELYIPPLAEQYAIASALTSVDNLIVSLDKQIAKTQSVKQGAMQQLLTGLNTEDVAWKPLKEVCDFTRGKGLSKKDKGMGDIPIILYGELYTTYGNFINYVVSKTSTDAIDNSPKIKKGDLLLPISSTTKEAQIGKVSVYCCDYDAYLGSDAILLRHNQISGYLVYILNSSLFEKEKMFCARGTTINHLDPKGLGEIKIPIPSIETQHKIASTLTAIDDKISALEAKRRKYEMVKVGMMQQLLTGKIRLK